MKRQVVSIVFFLFVMIQLVGCSGKVKVTGVATFEDGTPLPTGTVVFWSPTLEASGDIDGTTGQYAMGTVEQGDGIPPGEYKVYLRGVMEKSPRSTPLAVEYIMLVDAKYQSPDTSGMTCLVKGNTVYDFKVPKK